jgi:hypothetical protein
MPSSPAHVRAMHSVWERRTPEQRAAITKNARVAAAVRTVVDNWPELTDAQQQRLRALLQPVGGGHDG